MAFEEKGIAPISSGMAHIVSGQWWTYKSLDDALVVIEADGYFDALVARIGLSEVISVTDSTGNVELLEVETINPTAPRIITKKFVGSGSIADGSVTLPKLATGISPSHIVVFSDRFITSGAVGPSFPETFATPGTLSTDFVLAIIALQGGTPVTVKSAVMVGPNLTELKFSADPQGDHDVLITVLRAAV